MSQFKQLAVIGAALFGLAAFPAQAKVSEAEAAKLGTSLTAVGADPKANADGSIPAYTGGLGQKGNPAKIDTTDIYASEKPLYTITKANMAQYKDKLSVGHQKMLERYPTYKLSLIHI